MQLKLISSNIRFDNINDGIHSWENRRPHLQKIICDFFPDILATQEGRQPQIQTLGANIPLKLIDNHRNWIDERMYPCLFINDELFDVRSSGDIWLSKTPTISGSSSFKSAFPRLCTWAKLNHRIHQQDYLIVNTHLDHVLEDTRVEQINVLIKEIKSINKKNIPMILMGDFNATPKGPVRQKISEELHLKDPWIEKSLPEETSHHGFIGDLASGDRIDWILVPKSFAIKEIRMEKSVFGNVYPSDHYPMLATVIPS